MLPAMKRAAACVFLVSLVITNGLFGCSSESADGAGGASATGGAPGSGGHLGSGGQSAATGGITGSGGLVATGGVVGSGGAAETGGAVGTGGDSSTTGGSSGSGGVGGHGGAGAGGGGGNGGKAGGGGGSGGENVAFAPCPVSGNCAIMPLGDSITAGSGSSDTEYSNGGYRVELFRLAVTDSKRITFVGRAAPNGPAMVAGQPFPTKHEGYSGYRIDQISSLADAAISAGRPNIILLMIGTNDVNGNADLPTAATRLGNLLDRLTTDAPTALVVIAKITPTTNDGSNTRVRAYNDAIPALVQSRAATGKHIVMVDMYAALTMNSGYKTALMRNTLHPNVAGYVVMGQTWYAAIQKYLP